MSRIFKQNNLIIVMFILRVFADIFYSISLLDYILLGICLLICLLNLNKKMDIKRVDFLIVMLMILFFFSYIQSDNFLKDFIQIETAFLLYFIGRNDKNNINDIVKLLAELYLIVVLINIAWILGGQGSVTWGRAITIKGLYFFKTDFALVITYFLIFNLIEIQKINKKSILVSLLAFVLILFSNSRIFLMIYFIIILLIFLYYKGKKFQINFKIIIMTSFSVGVVLLLLANVSNIPILEKYNFISFNINTISDLFSTSNTMGRNEIWGNLFENFREENFLTQLFGAPLDYHLENSRWGQYEHSTYVKFIINTGYLGIGIFGAFVISIYNSAIKINNIKFSYVVLSLLCLFLISSYSNHTILYTANTWIPFYFFGQASKSLTKINGLSEKRRIYKKYD